jgi:micrococcal nuclease
MRPWAWVALLVTVGAPCARGQTPPLLLRDGREVVVAGVSMPASARLPAPGPLVLVDPAATSLDRYGRLRAQVATADGRWLQGALVEEGRAIVAPAADVDAAVTGELLRLEQGARLAGLGVWADGRVGPWPAQAVAGQPGDYVLVRGRVREVARRQEFLYLNFGEDWRRDFTVRAEIRDLRRLAAAGLDLAGLAGRNILVRGYLFDVAGPMIEVTHPAQIEVEP